MKGRTIILPTTTVWGLARKCSGDFLPPSPPAEQATARQDQAGQQVFLVSPLPWPFLRHHSRVPSFDTLEAAVIALVAMQGGERERVKHHYHPGNQAHILE
jgi:hypothetical protein